MIHESSNEEMIYSGGTLFRVDSEGCVREWPGDVITGCVDQQKKGKLVAVNRNSRDVIFRSESGRWIIEKMTRDRVSSRVRSSISHFY